MIENEEKNRNATSNLGWGGEILKMTGNLCFI